VSPLENEAGAPDLTPLVTSLERDPRVLGVARLPVRDRHDGRVRALIATTWDGLDPLTEQLRDLAGLVVDTNGAACSRHGHELCVVTPDGARLELTAIRVSDLKPSPLGENAEPLHDREGLLGQWVAWSRGRPKPDAAASLDDDAAGRDAVEVDAALRDWAALSPGSRALRGDGLDEPLRAPLAHGLRRRAGSLRAEVPAEEALRTRVHATLASMPQRTALRVEGGLAPRERFLGIADAEGFPGDRVLLDAAEAHLYALSGRDPVFVMGFTLATFDAVEARYALGEPVGGCQPPIVPGVYVGIAITPDDALAFWAAPCVSEATSSTACIADVGSRSVVTRAAGKDALVEALHEAIEHAHDALPSLLRRVRGAHGEVLSSPEATVRELHLPRSHMLAAGEHGAFAPGVNRLFSALALARAATDMEPLVARKLELAAGRLLASAPEAEPDNCL